MASPRHDDARIEGKLASMLLEGFVSVLHVTSGIFLLWALVVVFVPAEFMPGIVAGIVVIAASLFGTARRAKKTGNIAPWMRWVPSLVTMPVFVVAVYVNGTYALTSIFVVLAIHALFLPKAAGRWMMALTLAIGALPLAAPATVDPKLWVRLMFAAMLGVVLLDFAGRRILVLIGWLEAAHAKLTDRNRELATAKASIEQHRDHLESLVAELQRVNQELTAANRQLEHLAATDGLTGLNCRRRFIELADSEVLRSRRYGMALSLIMLDLDHFKEINDRFGHHAGDVALTTLAVFLENTRRANDVVGRLGGEEFAMLLPETSLEDARVVAERIRAGIAATTLNDCGHTYGVTSSIGIVQLGDEDLDALLSRADAAMYQAKTGGRNRVIAA